MEFVLAAVDTSDSDQVPAWLVLAAAALAPVGVILGAVITPVSERLTRKDKVKSYKRNIYRNFLDHGYWYRHLDDGAEKDKRAVLYVADWHRIRLISDDDDVLSAVEGMREPGSLTEQKEVAVLQAFIKGIGRKGLGDA